MWGAPGAEGKEAPHTVQGHGDSGCFKKKHVTGSHGDGEKEGLLSEPRWGPREGMLLATTTAWPGAQGQEGTPTRRGSVNDRGRDR